MHDAPFRYPPHVAAQRHCVCSRQSIANDIRKKEAGRHGCEGRHDDKQRAIFKR
jgi:hypothetical protein